MGRAIATKLEDAKTHGLLHLAQSNLVRCPTEIFSMDLSTTLFRLDLSFNMLTSLPEAIGSLVTLKILWVNNNPGLQQLPTSLANCVKLHVIDASSTALATLPCEYGWLQQLKVLDIRDTPLQRRWIKKKRVVMHLEEDSPNMAFSSTNNQHRTTKPTEATSCEQILTILRRKDERNGLKRELFSKLHDEVYHMERQDVTGSIALQNVLKRVLKHFLLADEVRYLIRNAERLFPSSYSVNALENIDLLALRRAFEALRDANQRKKCAADLEIKIRNLYFDRIDPSTVESMVKSIYDHIPNLQDVKFLIKHVAALFPKEAQDVDGREIHERLVQLQEEIARERAATVDKLLTAVKGIYSDTEPESVQNLVTSIAALFKNTKELRSLAADASILFPEEFLNAHPAEIRSAFLRMKEEALGTTTLSPAAKSFKANQSSSSKMRVVHKTS